MFCSQCGAQIDDKATYCTSCGAPQQAADAQPAQEPVYQQPVYAAPTAPVGEAHHGSVSFGDAIKLLFTNYANFTGRASKSEYWWGFLFNFLLSMAANVIPVVGSLISIAMLIPGLSLSIRRLHDIGKSWVWYLMGLIPLAGFIILIVYYCQDSDGDNQWGPGPIR